MKSPVHLVPLNFIPFQADFAKVSIVAEGNVNEWLWSNLMNRCRHAPGTVGSVTMTSNKGKCPRRLHVLL